MVSAYSIGAAKRGTKDTNANTPGPSHYSPDKQYKQAPPSWSIGKAERQGKKHRLQEPGPGSYQNTSTISAKGITIVGRHITESNRSMSPGPGSYTQEIQQLFKKAPAFTISQKLKDHSLRNLMPGPGQYDQSMKETKQSIKFTTAQRDNRHMQLEAPGPGNYDIDRVTKLTRSGPTWGFGRSKRDGSFHDFKDLPGRITGQYMVLNQQSQSKGFTMSHKQTLQFQHNDVPGPGAYEMHAETLKPKYPTFKIGTATRDNKQSNILPGPGYYDQSKEFPISTIKSNPAINFGNAKRSENLHTENTPGPGTYQIRTMDHGPRAVFIGSKVRQTSQSFYEPGPGHYLPNLGQTLERSPSVKIGTSPRDDKRINRETPGPALYKLASTLNGPKWVIGTSPRSRSLMRNDVPGPGTYKLPPAFADVPKYLLHS